MDRESDMTGTTAPSTPAQPQAVPPLAHPPAREAVDARSFGLRPPKDDDPQADDRRIPAFLLSAIVHTLLLLALAFFSKGNGGGTGLAIAGRQGEPTSSVTLEILDQEDDRFREENALASRTVTLNITAEAQPIQSSIERPTTATELEPAVAAALRLGGAVSDSDHNLRLPSGGLDGRSQEGRSTLGGKYGATRQSELAVDEALRWLAEHQRPNGSWSFNLELDPCGGRCGNSKKSGDTVTPTTGATGLALLAFLGAGHTHQKDGPYRETVRRGIYYLRAAAGEAEAGYDWQQGSMYGHGIALMALAEAHAMTSKGGSGDSDLKDLVHRGSWFTVIAQHDNGSWGYVPGQPGDTTLTGWQVLSLLAAKRTGAPLQTDTLHNARQFVLSTSKEREYSFGYQGPPGEPTTTAIGLTLLLYLGESPAYTPFYDALTRLAERGPTLTNVYHDYYGTLALHHSRHPGWDQWNRKLRDFLVANQAQHGHEKGSWHFKDKWGDIGGRLYTTAMCAMILEIYYRYQPLYAEIEEFPL